MLETIKSKELISGKYITVDKALNLINSGDVIVSGLGSAEAKEILSNLHKIANKVKDVTVTTCLPMEMAEYFTNEEYKDSFSMDGWFYTAAMRKGHKNGNISFIPNHLHLAAVKRMHHKKTNIYIGTATPPDKHGYLSLSLSNVYEKRMMEESDLVILEINKNYPRTFGDVEVHISDIDYVIETDYEVPALIDVEPNEKDLLIGKFIAECRKNKNMTQNQLAEMLNITNKSISKWENGSCLPDPSLYEPLCDILGITINELFAGQRIEKEDYQRMAEVTTILKQFETKEEAVDYLVKGTNLPIEECSTAYDYYINLFKID